MLSARLASLVRGRHAHWYLGTSGIFEGHLMLAWQERKWGYIISDHIGYPLNSGTRVGVGSRALRREILGIAIAMRVYPA